VAIKKRSNKGPTKKERAAVKDIAVTIGMLAENYARTGVSTKVVVFGLMEAMRSITYAELCLRHDGGMAPDDVLDLPVQMKEIFAGYMDDASKNYLEQPDAFNQVRQALAKALRYDD
jgi:hypothetical protein